MVEFHIIDYCELLLWNRDGHFLWLDAHHAIPDSNMGLNILWRIRLFFQFFA